VEEHLIVGNLGDARGIIGRSVADPKRFLQWKKWVECTSIDDYYGDRGCLWKEVTMVTVRRGRMNEHELKRLTVDHDRDGNSNWSTAAYNFDQDVIDIMKRCFSDRYQPSPKASAPSGPAYIESLEELAVSRSLGDRDFKAALIHLVHPATTKNRGMSCMLPFPTISRYFVGDL
jgi:serine/threonine protein phosphatase PrpC